MASHKRLHRTSHIAVSVFESEITVYTHQSINSPQDECICARTAHLRSVEESGREDLKDEGRKGRRREGGEKKREMKRSRKRECSFKSRRCGCDSDLMVGRYSLAGPDGLEKSVMTSPRQHHPNLFLIYTLGIMHSYNMTRKNKRWNASWPRLRMEE